MRALIRERDGYRETDKSRVGVVFMPHNHHITFRRKWE